MNQSKLTDLTVENILSTGVSVKMQISENLTNSNLESESVKFHKLIQCKLINLTVKSIFH